MPTPQEFALAIAPSSPGKKPSVAGSTPHDFALARAASSPGKKWPSDGFVVADARPPPPKPTTGPPQHKPVVPLSLIEELRLLDDKFKAREKELEAQRELLNQDRDRFEKAVMTKEWSLQRERHQLHADKEDFSIVATKADSVAAYQGAKISVVVSGGEPVHTTLETLAKREPKGGLAAAAKALLANEPPGGESSADARTTRQRPAEAR